MKTRLHRSRYFALILALLVPLGMAPVTLQAATYYWDANGNLTTAIAATGTWGTSNFWSTASAGNVATSAQTINNTSDVVFSAAANSTGGVVTILNTQAAHSITFDDATGGITLSGGTAINLGSATAGSGIFFTNSTGSANIISTPIILNSAATAIAISNSGTALQTIGDITGSAASGTQTITIGSSSSGGITLNGVIADVSGSASKVALTVNNSGAGIVTLSGSSLTYTGGTNVNAGTLRLSGTANMPATGTLQVNAGGNFSLADGIARTTTTGTLGLASGASLTFDWTGASAVDTLTSTNAATTTGNIGIIISPSGTPSGSGTLISSASGGLTTANGTQYFLANNTNFKATLTVSDTAVSIGSVTTGLTALTNAYWFRNQVTGATDTMAFSSGSSSNWSSTATSQTTTGVVPGGSAVNTVFINTGGNAVTLGANMNLGSITFNDSSAVTISGSNYITLNNTGGTAPASSGANAALTAFTTLSAIGVTTTANANNTINSNIIVGASQTWNVATSKTLTVNGNVSAGSAFSLTKAGAGTLKLGGTNSLGAVTVSAGSLTINGGTTSTSSIAFSGTSVSINNGGTLSIAAGGAAGAMAANSTLTITGGNGVISTLNLNGGDFGTVANVQNNPQITIDGAGFAGSAVMTNVGNLNWTHTVTNGTINITNGGQMNVSGVIKIGSNYYSSAGFANMTIGGGTATSTFTGNNQAFYIGEGERANPNNNTVTVSSNGVLTNIGNMFVGDQNYTGLPSGSATANQLAVSGTGTASMASITVGNARVTAVTNGETANANLVNVTSGGTLTTTSGTNSIGFASVAGAIANSNTLTVTGAGSTWNASNQNVIVGFANNASATSNNNILTVGVGGSLTNVATLTVGSGAGTKTGNKLVVNGSLSATTVSVFTNNTLSGSGTINGAVTVNGTLAPGNSIGTLTFGSGLTMAGIYSVELGTVNADPSLSLSDRSAVTGALVVGGNLTLVDNANANSQGSAAAGAYRIATYTTTRTGTFATITNPLSATLHEKVVYGPASGGGSVDLNLYRLAVANSITTPVTLGNVHVGGTFGTTGLSIQNTAASDGFSEGLNATGGSVTGGASVGGTNITNLGAGSTSSTITVGLGAADTSTAGAKSGTVDIGLASNGSGTSGYGTTALTGQNITVQGGVYRLADPSAHTPEPVTFGVIHIGDSFSAQTLSLTNNAVADAYSEKLNASFSGTTGDTSSAAGSFSLLSAGSTNNSSLSVNLSNTVGAKSGTATISLISDGTGTSGLGTTSLGTQTVNLSGSVFNGTATWTGAGSSWGTGASNNWVDSNSVNAAPGTFAGFGGVDTASFTNAGIANLAVSLNGTSPNLNAIVFNSSSSYTVAQGSGGSITLAGTTPSITTTGTHAISAPVTLGADSTFTTNASSRLTVSGAIGESGGARSLTVSGPGTTVLSNATGNSYTGGTSVNSNGILLVQNTSNSATGSGDVTVAGGSKLGGTGLITASSINITGDLFVGNTHASGGTAETLTLGAAGGNVTLGGMVQFDILSQTGTGSYAAPIYATTKYDQSNSNDLLRFTSSNLITLNGTLDVASSIAYTSFAAGDTWQIFDWGGFNHDISGLNVSSTFLPDLHTGTTGLTWDVLTSTTNLGTFGTISVVGVPEPSRAVLLFIGAAGLLMRRRRNR